MVFPAGGGIEGAPYVTSVGWRLDVKLVKPLEDWTPDGWVGLTVRGCHEIRVGLGACRGVAAGGVGLKVSRMGEEVFGAVACAASVEAVELFVGDEMEVLVGVGSLDVAFEGGGKGVRAQSLGSVGPRTEGASYG
jgi:hypothetical protein